MERTKSEHTTVFEKTTTELRTKLEVTSKEGKERYDSMKADFEARIKTMEEEHA